MFDSVRAWFVEARSYVGLAIWLRVIGVVVAVAPQQDHVHLGVAHAAD